MCTHRAVMVPSRHENSWTYLHHEPVDTLKTALTRPPTSTLPIATIVSDYFRVIKWSMWTVNMCIRKISRTKYGTHWNSHYTIHAFMMYHHVVLFAFLWLLFIICACFSGSLFPKALHLYVKYLQYYVLKKRKIIQYRASRRWMCLFIHVCAVLYLW